MIATRQNDFAGEGNEEVGGGEKGETIGFVWNFCI
jgi:hypothetical protein